MVYLEHPVEQMTAVVDFGVDSDVSTALGHILRTPASSQGLEVKRKSFDRSVLGIGAHEANNEESEHCLHFCNTAPHARFVHQRTRSQQLTKRRRGEFTTQRSVHTRLPKENGNNSDEK